MEIGPCKDETDMHIAFMPLALVLFWVFYNAFEIGTHSATEDALFLAVTIFLCAISGVVCISAVVYFGRTITLDSEGCCFSFHGFEKKYRWEELDVQYYKNVYKYRPGNGINSPGILINVKGRKYNPKKPAMDYCSTFHPMTSVFLSFPIPWDDLDPWKRSPMIRGYVIKREELLAVLEKLGHCPEVPDENK